MATVDCMAVRRLYVDGYRSLLDVSVDLGQVSVIVGANGTGKTNLYRALRLLHACAGGVIARAVVLEGGMDSITYAGHRRGEPRLQIAADLDDMTYEIRLATVARGGPGKSLAFKLDPVVVSEQISVPGPDGRSVDLVDRAGTTAFVRDDEGSRVAFPAAFHPSESVLSQLVHQSQYPELGYVRQALRNMRFHHGLRTDDEAPARQPALGTRTPSVDDHGTDLAAALRTIQIDGDWRSLAACVDGAFRGAELVIVEDSRGRLELGLSMPSLTRPLAARELSDGQLRFLYLAAALLSLRAPEVVVLNEPESSLHPDLLSSLAALVTAAAERSQIVVTTHSALLADSLLDAGATGVRLELSGGVTRVRPF
jgi:predicted ATPase